MCEGVCEGVKCTVNLTMLFVQCQKSRMQLNLFPVGRQIFVSQSSHYGTAHWQRQCNIPSNVISSGIDIKSLSLVEI